MSDRWLEGIWLGKTFSSDEHIVSMMDGSVVRARAVRAFPEGEKWSAEAVDLLKGKPSDPTGTMKEERHEVSIEIPRAPAEPEPAGTAIPRGMKITSEMTDQFGYTPGCSKCDALRRGDTSRPTLGHNLRCRRRMIERAQEDPRWKSRVESAQERKDHFMAEEIEKDEQEAKRRRGERAEEPGGEPPTGQPEDSRGRTGSANRSASMAEAPDDMQGVEAEKQPSEPQPAEDLELPTVGEEKRKAQDHGDQPQKMSKVELQPEDEVMNWIEAWGGCADGPRTVDGRCCDYGPPGRLERTRQKVRWNSDAQEMEERLEETFDLCEAFTPPRVTPYAREAGLKGGWSMDIRVEDPITGRRWDLSLGKDQNRAVMRVRKDKPQVLVVSPPCTLFSCLQNLSGGPKPEAY